MPDLAEEIPTQQYGGDETAGTATFHPVAPDAEVIDKIAVPHIIARQRLVIVSR